MKDILHILIGSTLLVIIVSLAITYLSTEPIYSAWF